LLGVSTLGAQHKVGGIKVHVPAVVLIAITTNINTVMNAFSMFYFKVTSSSLSTLHVIIAWGWDLLIRVREGELMVLFILKRRSLMAVKVSLREA